MLLLFSILLLISWPIPAKVKASKPVYEVIVYTSKDISGNDVWLLHKSTKAIGHWYKGRELHIFYKTYSGAKTAAKRLKVHIDIALQLVTPYKKHSK